jgi:hypothetical protein
VTDFRVGELTDQEARARGTRLLDLRNVQLTFPLRDDGQRRGQGHRLCRWPFCYRDGGRSIEQDRTSPMGERIWTTILDEILKTKRQESLWRCLRVSPKKRSQ